MFNLIALAILVPLSPVSCDIFTSLALILKFLGSYEGIINEVTDYVGKENEILKLLKQFNDKIEKMNMSNPSNPYEVYTSLNSLAEAFNDLENDIKVVQMHSSWESFYQSILPSQDYTIQAIETILHFQIIYHLSAEAIVNWSYSLPEGKKRLNEISSVERKVSDLHKLFHYSKENSFYVQALQWAILTNQSLHDDSINRTELLLDASIAAWRSGRSEIASSILNTLIGLDVNNTVLNDHQRLMQFDGTFECSGLPCNAKNNFLELRDRRYIDLCTTALSHSTNKSIDGICYYDHQKSPYNVIAPLQIEEIHKFPTIIRIHNTVSNEDSNTWLKKIKPTPEENRFAKEFWKPKSYSINLRKLSKIKDWIKDTTGSLLFGEHMNIHRFDFPNYQVPKELKKDDMKHRGTFISFLNDDVRGGNLVFPKLNLVVSPVKSSTLLIDNSHYQKASLISIFGVCPIISGSLAILSGGCV